MVRFASLAAQTADFRKLSGLARQAALESTAFTRGGNHSRTLTAFVKTDNDDILARYGCRQYARWGDIIIASIPLNQLAALSREPSVRRIEAGARASLCVDTAAMIVNALPAYEATPNHAAYTGEGVVMGLMDIGFDLTHPTFYDRSTTNYRIRALWDQLSKDTIDSRLPVGRDYIGTEELLAYGHSADGESETHGTLTLGIAAGSGYDTRYRGIAFDSDICLVANAVTSNMKYIDSTDVYKYTTATDALGFKYLFDYADSQQKPCVVSFSEGYPPYLDQDDSLFSAVIDSLTGPGHILVAAAGNESRNDTWFIKTAERPAAGAFIQTNQKEALYRLTTEGDARIHFYAYRGENGIPTDTLTLDSQQIPSDSVVVLSFPCDQDTLTVSCYYNASSFIDDDIWQVLLQSEQYIRKLAPIALVVEGDGVIQAYGSTTYAFTKHEADTRWADAQKGHNILAPACFQAVISVGATTHKPDGRIDYYSSTGPTMNGLRKPEVVAPGTQVAASMSHVYAPDWAIVGYSEFNGISYPWGADSGTSLSAPVVAGIIALWLQAKPDLSPQEVLALFDRNCWHPDDSLDYPNNIYGYGMPDAYKGLLDILGLTSVQAISHHQPQEVTIVPANGGLRLTFASEPTAPLKVSVYQLSGSRVFQTTLSAVGREAFIPLPSLASGVYAVQLDTAQATHRGSCLVRR
jgi:subtilisin family serine protease